MAKIRAGSKIASWMFGIAFCALVLGYIAFLRSGSTGSGRWITGSVWVALFMICWSSFWHHRLPRCVECGARFSQVHRGQEVCPRCRDRRMTPVAVKAGKRRAVYLTFAVYAFLGLLLSGLMTILLVDGAGWEFWRALAVSVLVIVVLIPAWLALFVAGFVVWYKASTSEKAMIARARKRAKEEGAIVELGPHRVWYAGDADPSALVNEQLATSRSRAEALLGGTSEPEKPMRIFLFNRRDDFEAFLRPFLPHAWCFDGFPLTPGTFAISTEDVPSHVVDVATTLRFSFGNAPMDQHGIPASVLWLRIGIARFLALPSDDEARRIGRKMAAAIQGGDALGIELFALKPMRMAKQIRNWYDSKSFRTYAQASFQSASMFRFLIAGGACPERLAALRGFLSDLKGEGAVEDLFAVRFGFNYEGFLKRWKDAIESEGPHDPAPGLAAEKIRNVVGPFIKDSQRPLMDRVVAIRDLGMGGYVEGAAALIELLRARGDIPEAEIIWALGAISGRTLGTDPEAWTAWIRDRRMLSEAPA